MEKSKPYKIGYVPGVYDLFHIGHLNLIRRSKERCEYLIVGVLTDELVRHFKGKSTYIPFKERLEIVASLKDVDKAVAVDFENTKKMDAWKLYHYDCHFSGDDHGKEWNKELQRLREVGSNMEFFPYTQSTSSTHIKALIGEEITEKKIYLFGAGKQCLHFLSIYNETKWYAEKWKIAGIIDNNESKNLTKINGITVYSPGYLKYIDDKQNIPIIITCKCENEIKNQLQKESFESIYYYENIAPVKNKIYKSKM